MSKNKDELLAEAKELNLDVNEEMTNADIQAAIDAHNAENADGAGDESQEDAPANTSTGVVRDFSNDAMANGQIASTPEHGNATVGDDGKFSDKLHDGKENK